MTIQLIFFKPSNISKICQDFINQYPNAILYTYEIKQFANRESYIYFPITPMEFKNLINNKIQLIILAECYPYPNNILPAILELGRLYKQYHPILFTPVLFYARQDALRFTIWNSLLQFYQKIIAIDIHNPNSNIFTLPINIPKNFCYLQSSKFKIISISILSILEKIIKKLMKFHNKVLLVAPDKGAENKIKQLSKLLNLPYIVGQKYRNSTGNIISLNLAQNTSLYNFRKYKLKNINNLQTQQYNAIIIDDIWETGKTIELTINALKHLNISKYNIIITHGLWQNKPNNSEKIYAINSLPLSGINIHHLPIGPQLKQAFKNAMLITS